MMETSSLFIAEYLVLPSSSEDAKAVCRKYHSRAVLVLFVHDDYAGLRSFGPDRFFTIERLPHFFFVQHSRFKVSHGRLEPVALASD
jgi:hypothetical protein